MKRIVTLLVVMLASLVLAAVHATAAPIPAH